jgi:hypothetical protein
MQEVYEGIHLDLFCFPFQNEALDIALTSLLLKMEAVEPDAVSRYEFL